MINLDKIMNYSFVKEDKQGCHYINEKIGSELTVYEPKRTHKSNRPKLALGEMSGEKRKHISGLFPKPQEELFGCDIRNSNPKQFFNVMFSCNRELLTTIPLTEPYSRS